jgi:hypothetical protein
LLHKFRGCPVAVDRLAVEERLVVEKIPVAARRPVTVKNSFRSLRVLITFVPHILRVERHMFAEVPPITARTRDRCDLSGCDGCIADGAVG